MWCVSAGVSRVELRAIMLVARVAAGALRRQRRSIAYETLDVFTATRFGGNPLAVVYDLEERLSTSDMQAVAAEFGYSETTFAPASKAAVLFARRRSTRAVRRFVLPPQDRGNTAWVRIFSPTAEMPFAGHPNVGTATALAWRGEAFGARVGERVRLEEEAGVVPVDVLRDAAGRPTGAMLTAPEAFAVTEPSLPVAAVADAVGLDASDLRTDRHPPLVATCGLPFILVELRDLDALARSRKTPRAFARAVEAGALPAAGPSKVHCYVRTGDGTIRCRMHRSDGSEDAGTGSANCALVGLLASASSDDGTVVSARILQGIEMGRPSELRGEATTRPGARRGAASVGAVRIGGSCAAVSRGELLGW